GQLAQALMSVHAVKAVELGTGVANSSRPGAPRHDEINYNEPLGIFGRTSNRAGGLEVGMTNGEELRIRGYLKPISTLRKALRSVNIETKKPMEANLKSSG